MLGSVSRTHPSKELLLQELPSDLLCRLYSVNIYSGRAGSAQPYVYCIPLKLYQLEYYFKSY